MGVDFGLGFAARCFGPLFAAAVTARSNRSQPSGRSSSSFVESDFAMSSPRLPEPSSFHQAVGRAIDAYCRVEAEEAFLIRAILKTDTRTAYFICFAIQNSSRRTELIENLLRYKFSNKFGTYWDSCSTFIGVLAQFRNAIAHWHPHLHIYSSGTETRYVRTLGPTLPSALPRSSFV